jgi:hypothetical protein
MRVDKELFKQVEESAFFKHHPEKKVYDAKRANPPWTAAYLAMIALVFFCFTSWYCFHHLDGFLYSVPMSLLFAASVILVLLSFCWVLSIRRRQMLDYQRVLYDCASIASMLNMDRQDMLVYSYEQLINSVDDHLVKRAKVHLAIEDVTRTFVSALRGISETLDVDTNLSEVFADNVQMLFAEEKYEIFSSDHDDLRRCGLANPDEDFYFRNANIQMLNAAVAKAAAAKSGNVYFEARDPIHTDH